MISLVDAMRVVCSNVGLPPAQLKASDFVKILKLDPGFTRLVEAIMDDDLQGTIPLSNRSLDQFMIRTKDEMSKLRVELGKVLVNHALDER